MNKIKLLYSLSNFKITYAVGIYSKYLNIITYNFVNYLFSILYKEKGYFGNLEMIHALLYSRCNSAVIKGYITVYFPIISPSKPNRRFVIILIMILRMNIICKMILNKCESINHKQV